MRQDKKTASKVGEVCKLINKQQEKICTLSNKLQTADGCGFRLLQQHIDKGKKSVLENKARGKSINNT